MVRRSAERDAVSPKPRGVCTGIWGEREGGKKTEKKVSHPGEKTPRADSLDRHVACGMWHVACGLIRSVVVVLANGKRRREG